MRTMRFGSMFCESELSHVPNNPLYVLNPKFDEMSP
jgi:hypothetical protein